MTCGTKLQPVDSSLSRQRRINLTKWLQIILFIFFPLRPEGYQVHNGPYLLASSYPAYYVTRIYDLIGLLQRFIVYLCIFSNFLQSHYSRFMSYRSGTRPVHNKHPMEKHPHHSQDSSVYCRSNGHKYDYQTTRVWIYQ